jgi:hypothetical protein
MKKTEILAIIVSLFIDYLLFSFFTLKNNVLQADYNMLPTDPQIEGLKDNISTKLGITENYSISVIGNCTVLAARISITDKSIQICSNSGIPAETLIAHELGHLKEPFWFRGFLSSILSIFMLSALIVYYKTKEPFLMPAFLSVCLAFSVFGSEFFAYYYSDFGFFINSLLMTLVPIICFLSILTLDTYLYFKQKRIEKLVAPLD